MEPPQAWLSELETDGEELLSCDEMMNLCDVVNNASVDSYSPQTYTVENMKLVVDQSFRTDQQDEIITADYYQEKNTFTLSFGNIDPKSEIQPFPQSFRFEAAAYPTKIVTTTAKNNFQLAQDHVLAERKRREKLSQHFISLSALIPIRRKMDKATLLEDACNHIKQLQDRVNELEELRSTKRKGVQECIVSMKRSNNSSSEETNSGESTDPCKLSPEIEVRISGSSVLVRIQCENKISSLVNTLNQMQKLGLSIISSNTMPFANTTILMITIVAQIEDDFCMTTKELVKNLQLAI